MELDPDDALEDAEGAALAATEDATTDDTTALGAALEPATPAVTEEPATPVEEGKTVAPVAPAAPVAETLPALDKGWPIEPPISLLPNVLDRRSPILGPVSSGPDSTYSQEHRPRYNSRWRNRSFRPRRQW